MCDGGGGGGGKGELKVRVQVGSEVQLKRNFARCEQPNNKNTRNSKLYFTGNGVVALFTGSRRSATKYNNGDDYNKQHP